MFSVIFENSNKADIFSLLQDRLNHREKWMNLHRHDTINLAFSARETNL